MCLQNVCQDEVLIDFSVLLSKVFNYSLSISFYMIQGGPQA